MGGETIKQSLKWTKSLRRGENICIILQPKVEIMDIHEVTLEVAIAYSFNIQLEISVPLENVITCMERLIPTDQVLTHSAVMPSIVKLRYSS